MLARFLRRAFRRPTSDVEIDEYIDLFRASLEHEPSFELALQFALTAALVSPISCFLSNSRTTDLSLFS